MAKIKKISAREILDSRGNPTIETSVFLDNDLMEKASVPSGASVGTFEALELRDNDPQRYGGLGVLKALKNVNEIIAPKLLEKDPADQKGIDALMISLDGSSNKTKLGANAILSVSLAIARVQALNLKKPLYSYLNSLAKTYQINVEISLPTPVFNVINGGKHGAGNLNFQEFQIIPASYKSFSQKIQIGVEIYHALKKVLVYRNAISSVGDEGGFAPNLFTNIDALEIIVEAIKNTSYSLGKDVFLGLDVAATHFKIKDKYQIKDQSLPFSANELITYYHDLNDKFHLLLLEDPLAEDDWQDWTNLTSQLGSYLSVIGDDLLVTNKVRLQKAITQKSATGILIKPNQIGTLTETLEVVSLAKQNGFKVIISHRSGETLDSFNADLAVAVSADYAKFGAPCRGERVAKYNRLLEISAEIEK